MSLNPYCVVCAMLGTPFILEPPENLWVIDVTQRNGLIQRRMVHPECAIRLMGNEWSHGPNE